jgi:DNA-binding response OmpR family regulator
VTAKRTTTPPRLLVVDNDARYGQWLGHHLGVFCPDSSLSVLNLAEFDLWCETDSGRDCDIMLLTASFGSSPEDPKARGLELLRRLRGRTIFPTVIALAEEGNELTAVRALQLGAVDYLPKRLLTPERLNTSVRLALRRIEKRVQRKLASLTHVTEVALPEEETREQPKPGSAAAAVESAASALVEVVAVEPTPPEAAAQRADAARVIADAQAAKAPESAEQTSDPAPEGRGEDLKARAEATPPVQAPTAQPPAAQTSAEQATTARAPAADTSAARITSAPADPDHPVHAQTAIVDVNALISELTRTDDRAHGKATTDPTPSSALTSAAAAAPGKAETNSSTVTADAGGAAATQLMSPGVIAAALDAAAASAMAAGIKATESSVFGTTAVGAASKSKSSKNGGPKKSGTPAPAVTAEFIPGYIIKMKIGESEKAVVYLATSISLGSNVALKVSKTLRDDTAGRQFLEREYTAIIAIRDPLVVQIYDYGVHAGFEYLAMEYLLSGDLKARMQAGLKESEALRYVEQIASALRVVHNAGLLHRDLKPPNVMLRENDEVALIDFGLARALDGSTPSTRTGVLRGSPYYMSPEQALGEVLDVRSDFYSLGIMFYEMLTGRKPYTGATAMEVLQQHVNTPLPALPHSLSRYEYFLNKLVAKNRAERFAQAEEIIAAIGELRTAMTLNVESAVA